MSGLNIQLEVSGLEAARARLNAMGGLQFSALLDKLGAQGVAQTQRRIQVEKTAPDGAAWPPTQAGGSILFKTGSHLSDSIQHAASAGEVHWGSGWIGAKVHQFGAVIRPVNARALAFTLGGKKVIAQQVTIPARAWLGVSAQNARELLDTAEAYVAKVLP